MMLVDATAARTSVANALCIDCALCCDGTFFGSVVVAPEEHERLLRAKLRVVTKDGALAMPQPCTALRGTACSQYADRPRACRTYECSMRERILAGTETNETARASLARMRELVAIVQASFDLPSGSFWDALIAIDESPDTDPMTLAGRRFDEGLTAIGELLELSRDVFEPALGGR